MRLVRLALLLTLAFVLPVLAIRVQPAAAGPLNWLFMPMPDCDAPCFLGVRPHESDISEAVARLKAHAAVRGVDVRVSNGRPFIAWNWLAATSEDRAFAFTVNEDIVDWLILPEQVRLGDLRLALGEPQRITATANSPYAPRVAFVFEYPARALHIYAEFRVCEIDQTSFWQMRADGDNRASFFVGLGRPDYIRVMPNRPVELDPTAWAKQLRDLCRS
jgi:hypothetical protein